MTEFSVPSANRFVRQMAVFTENDDGSWRRDDERHENVLIDVAGVPGLLAAQGLEVSIGTSFGTESLPVGLRTVVAHRKA